MPSLIDASLSALSDALFIGPISPQDILLFHGSGSPLMSNALICALSCACCIPCLSDARSVLGMRCFPASLCHLACLAGRGDGKESPVTEGCAADRVATRRLPKERRPGRGH